MKYSVNKCILFFLIFIVAILFNTHGYAQNNNQVKIAGLTKQILNHIRNKNFDKASELFHYPKSFTLRETLKEKVSVKESLRKYNDAFGEIINFRKEDVFHKAIGLGVSGANAEYWANSKMTIINIILSVEFKNEGHGFLKIGFCEKNNKLEIQGIEYALPNTDYSKKRLSEIIKLLDRKTKSHVNQNTL